MEKFEERLARIEEKLDMIIEAIMAADEEESDETSTATAATILTLDGESFPLLDESDSNPWGVL